MKNLIEINKGSIGTECLELIKNASKINELAKKYLNIYSQISLGLS